MKVLVLCTANQCRSPMAEALLQQRLAAAGSDAEITSAGELAGGVRASPGSVKAMATRGLDLGAHRSRELSLQHLADADLIIGMARRHVRNAVALVPSALGRTFTLKELVRRGTAVGRRRPDQPLEEWLAAVNEGRTPRSLLGEDARDDIADPIGGPDRMYEATAKELAELVDQLVELTFSSPATEASADNRESA